MDLIVCKSADGTFEIRQKSDIFRTVVTGLVNIEAVGRYVRDLGGDLGAVKNDATLGRYREAWIPDSK